MAQRIGNPASTARQLSQSGTTPIDGYIEIHSCLALTAWKRKQEVAQNW